MAEIRIPGVAGECVYTFVEDLSSGTHHRTGEYQAKAHKRLAAVLGPYCVECRSTAANHKRGSEACKRKALTNAFEGVRNYNPHADSMYQNWLSRREAVKS